MVARINAHFGQRLRLCKNRVTAVLTKFAQTTFFVGAVWICSNAVTAAEFIARVDRTVVTEGESLQLVVRISDLNSSSEPNVSALRQDFDVSSPSFSSQQRTIFGKGTQGFREWRYRLTPKHLGVLTIPSLNMDGQTTDPISIKVKPMSMALKEQLKQSLFFDVSTSKTKTHYVQGQILYTERLYFSLPLVNHQLTPLEIPNAVVIPLNEGSLFQAQYQNKAYQVIERQFAIFPQTSGSLTIPSQHYQGETRSSYFSQGKILSASTEPKTFDIHPRPADYPTQAAWLPANLVSLAAQWQGDPSHLKQGEPITLTLILSSEGLSSAQLPSIQLPQVNGLKYYQEPPKTEDKTLETGISGTKTLKIAIIPTQAGQQQIPDLRIPWFSVPDNQLKEARLSFPPISVMGNPSIPNPPVSSSTPAETTNQPSKLANISDPQELNPLNQTTQAGSKTTESALITTDTAQYGPVLFSLLALLGLSNGITLYLWLQARSRNVQHADKDLRGSQEANISVQEAIKGLKRAIQQQKASTACSACLAWAKAQWPDFEGGLNELADQLKDSSATPALKALDAYLFGHGDYWDGTPILHALQRYRTQRQPPNRQALISLYPAA